MLIAREEITGVVLCGGEGRRMGGVEKPLLPLHGRTLLAHVLERLAPQVGRVIISANREIERYRAFGHDVITDVAAGLGPLGGLSSVGPHVATPWVFCCPGDAPLLDRALVSRLAVATDASTAAQYSNDGERSHYLFLLVRTAALDSLEAYLNGGARSVHGWLAEIGAQPVAMPELAPSFANVNEPGALVDVRKTASTGD